MYELAIVHPRKLDLHANYTRSFDLNSSYRQYFCHSEDIKVKFLTKRFPRLTNISMTIRQCCPKIKSVRLLRRQF